MRADRLLSALMLLQGHGRLTGRELAMRLEVSVRTVHRDMEALSAAGVPVFALRGSRGGWQLDEGWRTDVPGLERAELSALLMAQPRALGDLGLAVQAERAIGKLVASLPDGLREQAVSMRQRLLVDPAGWRGVTEDLSMLPVVLEAVSRDRKLSMRYRPPRGEATARIVDPLGLVAKGSAWYLVARRSGEARTYRVSRMTDATVLDVPSDRPPGFDLAGFWKTSTTALRDARPVYVATLRMTPEAAAGLKSWRMKCSPPEGDRPDADGWITLRVEFDCLDEARFIVLGFGPRIDVVEPAALRTRVLADAAAIVERARSGAAQVT